MHVHYVLWKAGAPRFDQRAQQLESLAASLRKSGWHAGPQVEHTTCKIDDINEFFAIYITEWNVNKSADGADLSCHVADRVNKAKLGPGFVPYRSSAASAIAAVLLYTYVYIYICFRLWLGGAVVPLFFNEA